MKTDILQLPLVLGFLMSAGPIVDSFSANLERTIPSRAQRLVDEYADPLPAYAEPAPASELSRRVVLRPEAEPVGALKKAEEKKPLGQPVELAAKTTPVAKARRNPDFRPVPRPATTPRSAARMVAEPALPPLQAPARLASHQPATDIKLDAGLQVELALPLTDTLGGVQQPVTSLAPVVQPLVQTVALNPQDLVQPVAQTVLPELQHALPPLPVAPVLPKPELAKLSLPAVRLPQPTVKLPILPPLQAPLASVQLPLLPRL